MVKALFAFLLFFNLSSTAFADEEDLLIEKIKTFIDIDLYEHNSAYIDIIFSPKTDYYNNDRIDSVKVIQTLKYNGLLNLFF